MSNAISFQNKIYIDMNKGDHYDTFARKRTNKNGWI